MENFKPSTNRLQRICRDSFCYEAVKVLFREFDLLDPDRPISKRRKWPLFVCLDTIKESSPRVLKLDYEDSYLLDVFSDYLDIDRPGRINRASKGYRKALDECKRLLEELLKCRQ